MPDLIGVNIYEGEGADQTLREQIERGSTRGGTEFKLKLIPPFH